MLSVPERRRPDYRIQLRLSGDTQELAVNEEIRFMNGDEAIDRLCLRFQAAAYAEDNTSPAAVNDLFDLAYPEGFDPARIVLEGCWCGGKLTGAAFDPERPALLWIDAAAGPEESVELLLRFRLKVPCCAHLFGHSEGIVRLIQALPVIAFRENGDWDASPVCAYGTLQDTPLSDFSVKADLPRELRLVTGAETASDQLALLLVPEGMASSSARIGAADVTVLAGNGDRAKLLLNLAKRIWPVYEQRYGRLPLEHLALVSLPLTDSGYSAPGLVLLDSGLGESKLEQAAAYWLAGQWFGWALSTDEYRDGWLPCAARQWAALQYIRDTAGAGAEADQRSIMVDMPMRENLHAAAAPGMSPDGFPDQAVYRSVMDGRATALLYALDDWMGGRLDAFLAKLIRERTFIQWTRQSFSEAAGVFAGRDAAPLIEDYLSYKGD